MSNVRDSVVTVLMRGVSVLAILVSMALLPWWCTLALLLAMILAVPLAFEALILALVFDTLYGGEIRWFASSWFGPAALTLIYFFVVELLRPKLRFLGTRFGSA